MTPERYLEYLDEKASQLAASFASKHPSCATAVANAFAHLTWVLTQTSIPCHRRPITAVAYASRVLQHAHGAYPLLRTGNRASAETVMRAALEAAFVVGGLANSENFEGDKDFYSRLLYKSTYASWQPIEAFLRSATSLGAEDRERLEARQRALRSKLDELEPHRMSKVLALAQAAQMEDLYQREYAWQSRASHSDLEEVLNTHTHVDEDKHVGVRAAVFDDTDAPGTAAHIVSVLMETATALARLFEVRMPEQEQKRVESVAVFYGEALQGAR